VSVPAAFIGVVLIWATTPLAIKWSSEGAGFLFGVASRMVLGLFVCLVLIALLSRRLRWHRNAMLTYFVGGLGLWGAMTGVYWGAQFIPSGLISVLFGLSPVVTALMASVWLNEPAFTRFRISGMTLGLLGLGIVFGHSLETGPGSVLGMAAVLLSVHIHSASAVWIKRIDARLQALETATGTLLVALPLFALNWVLFDGRWPASLDQRTIGAIVYLAVFGSALGFVLYYYVLRNVQATRVALITLITPVIALFLGQWINGESVSARDWLGTGIILTGLACFQWGEHWRQVIRIPSRGGIRMEES
jgi:drug/metabolite transporter (DMT)-like permease